MGEALNGLKRTMMCGEPREVNVGEKITLMGWVQRNRKLGGLQFIDLRDRTGIMQIVFGEEINAESFEKAKAVRPEYCVAVTGEVVLREAPNASMETGMVELKCESIKVLSESETPPIYIKEGLDAAENIRLKYRYLDLRRPDMQKIFMIRNRATKAVRDYLDNNGFLEVETPILQNAVCGASAKPFYTHHNALDMDCNLRIAPETYLKQCVAGGFNRVYEMAKCFRNEGMDTEHLQEFTQVEWYASYWNFEDNIKFYQSFIRGLLTELTGSTKIEYQDNVIDFGAEWKRINYVEEMRKVLGFDFLDIEEPSILKDKVVEAGLFTYEDLDEVKSLSQIIDFIYKRKIRTDVLEPTIIYNYPAVLIPLARKNDMDKRIIDVFQVVACGTELCKAYSELVNPITQREAFEEQLKAKAQGDDETMELDESFLSAMEQGMPPISGLGFGIDRLMMIIFNQPSIRDVVLFPQMKDKK